MKPSPPLERRSRVKRKPRRPVRRFLLANVLPLLAIGTIAVLWHRGIIDIERMLPPGADENLIVVIVCIALLFVVASISLPAAHAVVKAADASFHRRTAVLRSTNRGARRHEQDEEDDEEYEEHNEEKYDEEEEYEDGDEPQPRVSGGVFEKIGALVSTPLFAAIYVVAWPIRFVLMLTSVVLLAIALVFTARLFEPEFLQAWVDRFR